MASPKGSIMVTGANGGLGSATVAKILRRPDLAAYTGIYAVRKAATATQLKERLQSAPKHHAYQLIDMDLSSIASVKTAATDINAKVADGTLPPIRTLILNAAYQDSLEMTKTDDGYETTWQVNALSNLILTLMLLQSMDKENGRILLISSWSHDIKDERNKSGGNNPYEDPRYTTLFPSAEALAEGKWNTPQEDPSWHAGYRRYGASKLCAAMFMFELAERIARDPKLANIGIVLMDPGAMPSDLARRNSAFLMFMIKRVMGPLAVLLTFFRPNGTFRTLEKSASDAIRACFDIESPKGKPLYLNGSDPHESSKETKDEGQRRELWQYGLRAADINDGDTALAEWK